MTNPRDRDTSVPGEDSVPGEIQAGPSPVGTVVPAALLARRYHGSLDTVTDSERRALRPIGASLRDVATRTGALLADLVTQPGVRIFQGVRSTGADLPRTPHTVCAGRRVILVESVSWPPGRYAAATTGRIHCDGVYIGQSTSQLSTAIGYWRAVLPRTHEVSAIVVVHPTTPGPLTLPVMTTRDITWVPADGVVNALWHCLPRRRTASRYALAALVAATESG